MGRTGLQWGEARDHIDVWKNSLAQDNRGPNSVGRVCSWRARVSCFEGLSGGRQGELPGWSSLWVLLLGPGGGEVREED